MGRFRTHEATAVAVASTSVAAATATWVATSGDGVQLTSDSVSYIVAARSLPTAYSSLAGQHLSDFPPGYPGWLRIMFALPLSETASIRLGQCLLAAVFAAAFTLLLIWLARTETSRAVLALAALVTVLNPRVLGCFTAAWSEGMFLTLVTVFALALAHTTFSSSVRRPAWWLLGFSALLLPVVRYTGIVVALGGGGLALLVGPARQRWRRALVPTLPALVAFGGILAWNASSGATPAGTRVASDVGVLGSVDEAVGGTMLFLAGPTGTLQGVLLRLLLGLAVVLTAAALLSARRNGGAAPSRYGKRPGQLLVGLGAIYLVALVGLRAVSGFDSLAEDARLLVPGLVLLAAPATQIVVDQLWGQRLRPALDLRTAATVAVGVYILAMATQGVLAVGAAATDGLSGFNSPHWQNSATVAATRSMLERHPDTIVVADAPQPIALALHVPVLDLPERTGYHSPERVDDGAVLVRRLERDRAAAAAADVDRQVLLVDFNEPLPGRFYPTSALRTCFGPGRTTHAADGTLTTYPLDSFDASRCGFGDIPR